MTLRFDSTLVHFTSDTHFGHANIIPAAQRPFKNVEEMNDALVSNWNAVVRPNDVVFHLGDVSFARHRDTEILLSMLNGQIHLIRGNHDKQFNTATRARFTTIHDLLEIDVREPGGTITRLMLCHYAMRTWNRHHFGAWQLHGHSHGHLVPIGRQMDVGVDNHNFTPLNFEQIKERLAPQPVHIVDQHKPE